MSRGPGKIERALVGELSGEWSTMRELAKRLTDDDPPSRAAVESVRRACRRLAERGRADLDYLYTGYPSHPRPADGRLWSSLGDGRDAYTGGRPAAPCWELVARLRA